MRRKIVLAGAITGLIGIVVVVGLVLRGSDDQIGVSESPLALDRPEVRTPACPSAAAMVWAGRGWTMTAGPVRLNFPFPVVGPTQRGVRAVGEDPPGRDLRGGAVSEDLAEHRCTAGYALRVQGRELSERRSDVVGRPGPSFRGRTGV